MLIIGLIVPIQAHAAVDDVEREEVRLINEYRVSQGLSRLVIDVKLNRTADWMAADMPAFDYFSHTDHLGRDPFQRLAAFKYPTNSWRGENLAAGNEDAAATFQQWRESEGHRLNMVNRNYRAIGIARVADPASTYGYYWVTEFGSKVTKRGNSGAAKAKTVAAEFSAADQARIRKRARRCERLRTHRSTWRRMNCGWHVRQARRLGLIAT